MDFPTFRFTISNNSYVLVSFGGNATSRADTAMFEESPLCLQTLLISSSPQAPYSQALVEIGRKHAERIRLFGRFPERNHALGRVNTVTDQAYLDHLK